MRISLCRRRRAVTAIGAALLAGAFLVAPASQAGAEPAGAVTFTASSAEARATAAARADGERRMERQRPLVAAASKVRWEIERLAYPGFAGIALEDAQVALWWKGAVPASMTAVVAQARRIAPVRIAPAAHSLAELQAAAATIRARVDADPSSPVHAVKIPADGSGLVLGTEPARAAASVAPALPRVDVPVTIVREAPLTETSRDDDAAPWSGGAMIRNGGSFCTAGFGVRNGANARYILTAAHCGQSGNRITDGRGEWIGDVGPRHQDHDVALIPTSNASDRIYVGGANSNSTRVVDGWDWTFVGEFLCQSGVTSANQTGGPVCNIKVLFYYNDREDLVEAEQMNGQPAARGGDSGGPIYSNAASGGVIAKGTVTRTAGARLGFQDFGTAWRDFGIYIPK